MPSCTGTGNNNTGELMQNEVEPIESWETKSQTMAPG